MKKLKIICVLFSALFSFSTLTSFTTLTKENGNNLLGTFENESIVFNYNETKYEVQTSDYYFYKFSDEKIFADPIDLKNNVENLELINWKVNSENGKIINSLSLKIEDEFINVTSYDMTSSEFSNLREMALQGDENIKKKVIIKTKNALESLPINNPASKTRSMPTNSELESMTSTDRYIDSYQPDYDYFDNRGFYERDSITNLIPLEYFKNIGTYYYIGKEYGFFIKTIINPNLPYIKINSVILFDIEVTFPNSSQRDTLTYEIDFVVNECYQTRVRDGLDDGTWAGLHGHPDYNYSLIAPMIDTFYFIQNPKFAVQIKSQDSINYGEPNYVLADDHGDFIIGYSFAYNGETINLENDGYVLDIINITATIASFFVPSQISAIISASQLVTQAAMSIDAQENYYHPTFKNTHVTDDNTEIFRPGATAQENTYGGLLKNVIIDPYLPTTTHLIFGNKALDTFVRYNLYLNVRDGVDPADTNDVYQLTELQVVEDNTYVNIFGQVEGTIDLITNVSANRYLGEYQREI